MAITCTAWLSLIRKPHPKFGNSSARYTQNFFPLCREQSLAQIRVCAIWARMYPDLSECGIKLGLSVLTGLDSNHILIPPSNSRVPHIVVSPLLPFSSAVRRSDGTEACAMGSRGTIRIHPPTSHYALPSAFTLFAPRLTIPNDTRSF
jgi:hypothetical protein